MNTISGLTLDMKIKEERRGGKSFLIAGLGLMVSYVISALDLLTWLMQDYKVLDSKRQRVTL